MYAEGVISRRHFYDKKFWQDKGIEKDIFEAPL